MYVCVCFHVANFKMKKKKFCGRASQVGLISQRISRWLETAEKVFLSIEENVASTKSEEERKKKRQEELKERIEKAREELKVWPGYSGVVCFGFVCCMYYSCCFTCLVFELIAGQA